MNRILGYRCRYVVGFLFLLLPLLASAEGLNAYASKCAAELGIDKVPGYTCTVNSVLVPSLIAPGISSAGNYLGKVRTNNPDVYGVFLCRDADDGIVGLNGYILQNRLTGKTCFFDAKRSNRADQELPSPAEDGAEDFWEEVFSMNGKCVDCHTADAYIVTPGLSAGFNTLGLMHLRNYSTYKIVGNADPMSFFFNWENTIRISANTCANGCHRLGDNFDNNAFINDSSAKKWMPPLKGSSFNFNPRSGQMYSMQSNGQIWGFIGSACAGNICDSWSLLDNNAKTRAIAAAGGQLYQLRSDATIWRFKGTPCSMTSCTAGWELFDNNPKTIQIAAGGSNLYQLHSNGDIWRSKNKPCVGTSCVDWERLDAFAGTVQIVAAAGNLYQRHSSGAIMRYTGVPCTAAACTGWQQLDFNAKTIDIAADAAKLYQLHNTGEIWTYTGAPCSGGSCPGWSLLDNNSNTKKIVAGGNQLYQLHSNGSIWRYKGVACSNNVCTGWEQLDRNTNTVEIAASSDALLQRHSNGNVYRYTNKPCTQAGCTGWERVENFNNTTSLSAARQ